jgi:hypothetical protein
VIPLLPTGILAQANPYGGSPLKLLDPARIGPRPTVLYNL